MPTIEAMPTLAENVSRLMKEKGLSELVLARLVGVSQPTINSIATGKQLTTKALPRLAAALGVTPGDLDPNYGKGSAPLFGVPAGGDLPIYGAVEAGDGAIIISNEVTDTYPRPAKLANVADAYALYVQGESMVPVYRPGDLIILHPHIPPRRDDAVVLYSEDDGKATLKEFIRSTDDTWILQRYYPEKKEFSLKKKDWPRCHLVYARYSRG